MLHLFQLFSPGASAAIIEVPYIVLRKTIHFILYAVLTFLLYRAFRGEREKKWDLRWAFSSAVIAVSYGWLDEFLQTFILDRNGSVLDAVIDSIGVLFALGITAVRANRNKFNEKNVDQDQKGELSQETL